MSSVPADLWLVKDASCSPASKVKQLVSKATSGSFSVTLNVPGTLYFAGFALQGAKTYCSMGERWRCASGMGGGWCLWAACSHGMVGMQCGDRGDAAMQANT